MGTILIDKLLQTVVNRKASDLHIAVGQPPVLRLDGRMKRLETKVLEPEDTVALMKSIAPERCQQELQEVGGADFGFAFGDWPASASRSSSRRATWAWSCGRSPTSCLNFEDLGTPAGAEGPCHAAPRAGPGHRADRLGQDDHPGGDDRLHQRELSTTTSSRSRTRSSSTTRTRSRRSTSGRSASTCPVSPRPSAAPCGRTRT